MTTDSGKEPKPLTQEDISKPSPLQSLLTVPLHSYSPLTPKTQSVVSTSEDNSEGPLSATLKRLGVKKFQQGDDKSPNDTKRQKQLLLPEINGQRDSVASPGVFAELQQRSESSSRYQPNASSSGTQPNPPSSRTQLHRSSSLPIAPWSANRRCVSRAETVRSDGWGGYLPPPGWFANSFRGPFVSKPAMVAKDTALPGGRRSGSSASTIKPNTTSHRSTPAQAMPVSIPMITFDSDGRQQSTPSAAVVPTLQNGRNTFEDRKRIETWQQEVILDDHHHVLPLWQEQLPGYVSRLDTFNDLKTDRFPSVDYTSHMDLEDVLTESSKQQKKVRFASTLLPSSLHDVLGVQQVSSLDDDQEFHERSSWQSSDVKKATEEERPVPSRPHSSTRKTQVMMVSLILFACVCTIIGLGIAYGVNIRHHSAVQDDNEMQTRTASDTNTETATSTVTDYVMSTPTPTSALESESTSPTTAPEGPKQHPGAVSSAVSLAGSAR
ncbi:unnamed protein product [Sympodiomycopsis kandeliae]